MPISPEDAGAEIQRFLVGLNASKHTAREKALKAFRAFVEKQGMEFYDDDVDSLLLGDGYTMGLMQWCGESSTGTQGALKRSVVCSMTDAELFLDDVCTYMILGNTCEYPHTQKNDVEEYHLQPNSGVQNFEMRCTVL